MQLSSKVEWQLVMHTSGAPLLDASNDAKGMRLHPLASVWPCLPYAELAACR